MVSQAVKDTLRGSSWFGTRGAWVLLDGQFGSTGKGLAAAMLAEVYEDQQSQEEHGGCVDLITSNAGPNSGHTFFNGDERIVLQQLPSYGVMASRLGRSIPIYLNGGAVIDRAQLFDEITRNLTGDDVVKVNNFAAYNDPWMKDGEQDLVRAIGSTGKGVGAAIARKVMRDPDAVVHNYLPERMLERMDTNNVGVVFVEVSQGYSLGINQGFYPFCTSRGCDVGQALSDAEIHPKEYRDCMMVVRTFPIRVAGNSGPCYSDQHEITWDWLRQTPEQTTVTRKTRRVFTWSKVQFQEAVQHNQPGFLFVNFLNYLPLEDHGLFIKQQVLEPYREVMGNYPELVLGSTGAKSDDVGVYYRRVGR